MKKWNHEKVSADKPRGIMKKYPQINPDFWGKYFWGKSD